MTKTLIIPDCHASPEDEDYSRFAALGEFMCNLWPDRVVCLGDFADMPSLCSYDKGTKGFEGRRYTKDISSAKIAMANLLTPMWNEIEAKKKSKKKPPKMPELIMCLGNHEERINRAIKYDPILDGTISVDDLGYAQAGWTVLKYMEPYVDENGISYAHCFPAGLMNRPISGEHPAYSLVTKQLSSCVAGHSHLRDFCERTTVLGERIFGLFCGSFVDRWQDYAGEAQKMWWNGVVVLGKDNNLAFISLETILRNYYSKGGEDVSG